jgi:hypothetical protein
MWRRSQGQHTNLILYVFIRGGLQKRPLQTHSCLLTSPTQKTVHAGHQHMPLELCKVLLMLKMAMHRGDLLTNWAQVTLRVHHVNRTVRGRRRDVGEICPSSPLDSSICPSSSSGRDIDSPATSSPSSTVPGRSGNAADAALAPALKLSTSCKLATSPSLCPTASPAASSGRAGCCLLPPSAPSAAPLSAAALLLMLGGPAPVAALRRLTRRRSRKPRIAAWMAIAAPTWETSSSSSSRAPRTSYVSAYTHHMKCNDTRRQRGLPGAAHVVRQRLHASRAV